MKKERNGGEERQTDGERERYSRETDKETEMREVGWGRERQMEGWRGIQREESVGEMERDTHRGTDGKRTGVRKERERRRRRI